MGGNSLTLIHSGCTLALFWNDFEFDPPPPNIYQPYNDYYYLPNTFLNIWVFFLSNNIMYNSNFNNFNRKRLWTRTNVYCDNIVNKVVVFLKLFCIILRMWSFFGNLIRCSYNSSVVWHAARDFCPSCHAVQDDQQTCTETSFLGTAMVWTHVRGEKAAPVRQLHSVFILLLQV